MVFVKVRETYDLQTIQNKMTVIGIHTPKPSIIKYNYPGLLMQCKAYRPVSCDVRVACASMLPLDPLGVGTEEGDVAPEDVFNPILYKAMSNKGMSQLEARIQGFLTGPGTSSGDVDGASANVEVDDVTSSADEFPIYYALLSNTHDWKHASPQSGLSMSNLRPLVYEMVYNVGDMGPNQFIPGASENPGDFEPGRPAADGGMVRIPMRGVLGKAKEFPFLNCTSYSHLNDEKFTGSTQPGFPINTWNSEIDVPYLPVMCGCIIVPPSRLHTLFYRMVVEWTIEFSGIRPLCELSNWAGTALVADHVYYKNYSYSATKEALTGSSDTIMDNDSCMVSANVGVTKVM